MVSTVTNVATSDAAAYRHVFGGRDIRDGSHEGYRMDFGMWLDHGHSWGMEADYFDLNGKADSYDSGFTNGFVNGTLFPIVRGVFDPCVRRPDGQHAVGDPQYVRRPDHSRHERLLPVGRYLAPPPVAGKRMGNRQPGRQLEESCARTFRIDGIVGYRFARLIDTVNNGTIPWYAIGDSTTTACLTDINSYRTVNNFNGCDLGLDVVIPLAAGQWTFSARLPWDSITSMSRTTIGERGRATTRAGGMTISAAAHAGVLAGPLLGLPELTVTGGYQFTDHLKFTVGYDLLYWTAVVRAADQIAVQPTTGLPYGTQIGSTLPPFSFNESHFLAQGVRLGGEFRF